MSAWHLSELRSALSFVFLVAYTGTSQLQRLRITKHDLPRLAWLGVAGQAPCSRLSAHIVRQNSRPTLAAAPSPCWSVRAVPRHRDPHLTS